MVGEAKSEELFRRLSMREDFQDDIRKCRNQFDIDPGGFSHQQAIRMWFKSLGRRYGHFLDALEKVHAKYRLTAGFANHLEGYVITGHTALYPQRAYAFAVVDTVDGRVANRNRAAGIPFVSLLVYEHATQRELRDFLKHSWKHTEKLLRDQRGSKLQRLRQPRFAIRDAEILKLYESSKEELARVYEQYCGHLRLPKPTYRHMLIARIVSEKHKRSIDPDHIKKIVERQRKARSGNS